MANTAALFPNQKLKQKARFGGPFSLDAHMVGIKLKALKPLVYASRRIPLGQEFDARGESDARVLCAIKSAVRVTETDKQNKPLASVDSASAATKSVAPTYSTRMLTAEVPRSFTAVSCVIDNPSEHVAALLPEVDATSYPPGSTPLPVNVESDLDAMSRDALYDLATSIGLKPHHLMGAAKLRAAIAEHRAATQ